MNSNHKDLEKIEDGLSKKLIYRKTENENTKIIIDFSKNKQEWYYAFHGDTLPINDVDEIGIAANDRFGNIHIKRLKFKGHKVPKEF